VFGAVDGLQRVFDCLQTFDQTVALARVVTTIATKLDSFDGDTHDSVDLGHC